MAKRTCQRCGAGGGVFAGRDADGGLPMAGFAHDLLAGLRVKEGISIAPLTRDWRAIAGERLAAHTRPERVERGTAIILVDGAPWMMEARRALPALLAGMRRNLGEQVVQRVRLLPDSGPQDRGTG
jgi:hypothetical protein